MLLKHEHVDLDYLDFIACWDLDDDPIRNLFSILHHYHGVNGGVVDVVEVVLVYKAHVADAVEHKVDALGVPQATIHVGTRGMKPPPCPERV